MHVIVTVPYRIIYSSRGSCVACATPRGGDVVFVQTRREACLEGSSATDFLRLNVQAGLHARSHVLLTCTHPQTDLIRLPRCPPPPPSPPPTAMDKHQPSGRPGSSHPASTTAATTQPAASTGTTGTSHPNQPLSTLLPSPSTSQPPECQQQHQDKQASAQPADTVYPHQIHGLGGPTATAPFLRDFSLVAEAASRAQVSLVTRDLEGVSL